MDITHQMVCDKPSHTCGGKDSARAAGVCTGPCPRQPTPSTVGAPLQTNFNDAQLPPAAPVRCQALSHVGPRQQQALPLLVKRNTHPKSVCNQLCCVSCIPLTLTLECMASRLHHVVGLGKGEVQGVQCVLRLGDLAPSGLVRRPVGQHDVTRFASGTQSAPVDACASTPVQMAGAWAVEWAPVQFGWADIYEYT